MPASPGNGPGQTPNYKKYCLNCDKRIRQTGTQARSHPRKIGNTQIDGYVSYLEANGKPKTKEEVLSGYICNPCYCQYQAKYKGQYDQDIENRRKSRTNHSNAPCARRIPVPSTSRETAPSTDPVPASTTKEPQHRGAGQNPEPPSDQHIENEDPEQDYPMGNSTGKRLLSLILSDCQLIPLMYMTEHRL